MAAYYLPQNAGARARKYIRDQQLLSFIDAEVDTTTYFIHGVFHNLLRVPEEKLRLKWC